MRSLSGGTSGPSPVFLVLLAGCVCGRVSLSETIFGGGSVSIVLTPIETGVPETVLGGEGTATGWDPSFDPPYPLVPGGRWVRPEHGEDLGQACVAVDRVPTEVCPASMVCVEWTGQGEQVSTTLYADGETMSGNSEAPTSFSAPEGLAGSLRVDGEIWTGGYSDCGTSDVAVEWAFDEAGALEVMSESKCR